MSLRAKLVAALSAGISAATLASPPARPETPVVHGEGLAGKKDAAPALETNAPPVLSTLVQVHSNERVVLDAESPTPARFDALLADRATASTASIDPRLIDLLRAIVAKHPGATIELVSGYRSAKLNEMMRKKGHHVSSHSQHSLGNAVDFRVVPGGAETGVDPRVLEREVRKLGWKGGVGVYPTRGDWFVHCDVGQERRWVN